MIVIIPSAKTFHQLSILELQQLTKPRFEEESIQLMKLLQQLSQRQLTKLMKISDSLSAENEKRNQKFFEQEERPAIGTFHGAMYKEMHIDELSLDELHHLQGVVRILSGLYGMLRPLDCMREYRLEMATSLANVEGDNLYAFWRGKLTDIILKEILEAPGEKILVNLSSTEYSKALYLKEITKIYPVVEVVFKEQRGDTYKILATYAKQARGKMIHYIAKQRVTTLAELKNFNEDGYCYCEDFSSEHQIVFLRKNQ